MKKFRLITKMISENCAEIWYTDGNGNGMIIARILLPADQQRNDDYECLQEVCTCLRRRIRKSI